MGTIKLYFIIFFFPIAFNVFAQPANDICSGAATLLQDGTCANGTTVSAGDDWVGTVGCQSGNNHPEVWYTFTATGTLASFIVTSGTLTGDVELLLVSATGACAGLVDAGSQCGPSPLNASFSVDNGTLYYVTVSSSSGSQGTFSICETTTTPPASCTDNDDCSSPTAISFTTGVQTCLNDCNTGAAQGPNFSGNNCWDFTNETVWYEVTTTASSATMDISVTSSDFSTPYFTVFTTSNCTQFTVISCEQGTGGSVSSTINVSASTTYLIAISDVGGNTGNFDLCVTVNDDNSACNQNNSLVVTATSMGSPLAGPYLPGEVVSFCYSITDFTQANCNYLQGIVPTFGDCWDPASFDAQGQPVTITTPLATAGVIQPCPPGPPCPWAACEGTPAGTWSWFPAGAVTYNNINNPNIPNGTAMGSGWYFLSSYNPATGSCTGDPTDPDNSYGDSDFNSCTASTLDWSVCFDLIAGPASNCISGETNCSVTFKTFADGEIGVWDNVGCTSDISSASPSTTLYCCSPTPTAYSVGGGGSYCTGGTGVPVTLANTEIGVDYELYLNGTPTGNIIPGTGAAISFGNQTTAGTYTVAGTITATSCPGSMLGSVTITISTLPTPSILPSPASVCTNTGLALNGNPSGGSGTYSTHLWSGAGASSLSSTSVVNPTFTNAAAGTYALTYSVTDDSGCTGSTNTTVTVTGPSFSITPASPSICLGDTVTLSATITLDPINYQSSFTDNDSVVIPNNNVAGIDDTIIVSGVSPATLSSGSIVSVCFTINHSKHSDIGDDGNADAVSLTSPSGTVYNSGITPLPNVSGSATYCFPAAVLNSITGNANGIWILNINDTRAGGGGTGAIVSWTIIFNNTNTSAYSWSPTTDMINSGTLSPGVFPAANTTYTLSATDALGCAASMDVPVTVNSLPAAPTASGATICSGGTATLTATAPGGTYQWYSATTGGSLLFTGASYTTPALSTATTYYVQTTVGGCPGPRTPVTVSINPVLTVSNIVVTCSGDNTTYTVTFDINGGDAGSYSVTGDAGTLTGNTFTSDPVTSGNSYSFTASDSYDCTPQTVSGSQNCSCAAAATVSGGGTTCSGTPASDIVFTLAGSAPWDLTYSINGTPQTPVTGIAASPYTITNPSAGTYTISSISDGSCTGSGSGSATVTVNTLPSATVSGGGSICDDGTTDTISIALTGTGPWSITYDIDGTPQAPVTGINSSPYNILTSGAGTYTVSAVSDANCSGTFSGSATITVNALPAPTITPDGPVSFCQGDTLNLASSVSSIYNWSTGVSTQSINVTASGTYNVTVTDGNGCSGAATPVTVTVYSNPSPTLTAGGATTFCSGDSVQLTSSVSVSYLWSTGATSQSIYADSAGTFVVTITDGNGCIGDTSVTVTVNANPTSSTSTTDENCGQGDGTATVAGSGGATPYTYQWDASAGNQATSTAISLVAGSYNVTTTDANGCIHINSATVNSPAGLSSGTSATVASCGNCNGTATVTPTGGISPYTYLWADGQTDSTATGLCSGSHSVTVTDNSGGGGCTYSTAVNVTGTPSLSATADSLDATCGINNGEASAYPSGGTSPFTYLWNNSQTDVTATGLGAGTYSVTVTDVNSCTATASTVVDSIAPPAVSVTSTNINCNGADNGQATATPSSGTSPYTYLWSNALSSATITGLSPATYYITITDANSCTVVDSAVITQPQPLTATATPTDVLCNGDGNGQASVTANGGTTGYTYLWSDGQTNSTATGLSGGAVSVTVTDDNGCTTTASAAVNEPAVLSASISSVDVLCNGNNTGEATVTASGGTTSYAYLWSNGQTGATATALTAGSYTVTVTDVNGCDTSALATITQPIAISNSMSSSDANCGLSDGSATVTPSGGVSPYTYLWTDGQTDSSATALDAGNYIVTVTDANGCTATGSATVGNAGGFTATAVADSVSCNGSSDGEATATPAGGTSPITYQWDAAAGDQTTQTATGLAAGTYSVTVTDNVGCTFDALVTVEEPALLTVSLSASDNICNGDNSGQVAASVSGGTTSYSYLWGDGQTGATATGLTAGTYSLTVTDNNGCTVTDNAAVSEPASISTSVSTAICAGDSIFLQGAYQTAAGTYYDTLSSVNSCDSSVATTLAINPSYAIPVSASICSGDSILLQGSYQNAAGTYYDTLASANGCDSVFITTLSINQVYAIPLSATICSGDSILLQGAFQTAAGTYYDSLSTVNGCDSVFITTLTVNPSYSSPVSSSICPGDSIFLQGAYQTSAGTYYDTLSSVNGCDSVFITSLSVNPSYSIPVSAAICSGDSILLQGSYQATAGTYYDTLSTVSGCDSILTTTLTVNSGTFSTVAASICSGDSIFLQGSYQVTAGTYYDTLTGVNACDSVIATALTVNSVLSSNTSSSICAGDSIFVGGNYQNTAGTYYDTLTAANGCDSIIATTLSVTPPSSSSGSTSICSGDSILLGGSYQSTAGTYYDTLTAANGCDSIVATALTLTLPVFSSASSAICEGDSIFLQGAYQNSAGTYYDTLTSSSGCDSVKITTLTVNLLPAAAITGDSAICIGENTMLTASGNGTYLWSTGATSTAITESPAADIIYSVTVTNSCGSDVYSLSVDVSPLPDADAGNDTTVFQEEEINLTATGGTSYVWSTVPPEASPSVSVTPEATTTYYVTVTDANGCTAVDSVMVTVDFKYIIFVPSMFSPNGDGHNDAVFVRGKGIETISFAIYDRWGEKVFETSDISIGWDGKYREKEMNSAVFVYVLNATMDDGNAVEQKGNITLVR